MVITGSFHILHTINTAWALQARKISQDNHQNLVLKLKDNDICSYECTLGFLKPFGLAHEYQPFFQEDKNSPNAPPIPSREHAGRILESFFSPKKENTIFKNLESFLPTLSHLQSNNKTFVTTNGCFDVLHPGHIKTLQCIDTLNHIFIVLINSDQSIARFKGPDRPIHDWFFRAGLLSQINRVDYVVVFEDDTPVNALRKIRPARHVKGGSFISDRIDTEQRVLSEWGGQLHMAPMVGDYSSTRIIERYSRAGFPV